MKMNHAMYRGTTALIRKLGVINLNKSKIGLVSFTKAFIKKNSESSFWKMFIADLPINGRDERSQLRPAIVLPLVPPQPLGHVIDVRASRQGTFGVAPILPPSFVQPHPGVAIGRVVVLGEPRQQIVAVGFATCFGLAGQNHPLLLLLITAVTITVVVVRSEAEGVAGPDEPSVALKEKWNFLCMLFSYNNMDNIL